MAQCDLASSPEDDTYDDADYDGDDVEGDVLSECSTATGEVWMPTRMIVDQRRVNEEGTTPSGGAVSFYGPQGSAPLSDEVIDIQLSAAGSDGGPLVNSGIDIQLSELALTGGETPGLESASMAGADLGGEDAAPPSGSADPLGLLVGPDGVWIAQPLGPDGWVPQPPDGVWFAKPKRLYSANQKASKHAKKYRGREAVQSTQAVAKSVAKAVTQVAKAGAVTILVACWRTGRWRWRRSLS